MAEVLRTGFVHLPRVLLERFQERPFSYVSILKDN